LLGHSLLIEGSADNGTGPLPFLALLDIEDTTQMIGAPFELAVDEDTQGDLSLQALTIDPLENDTLFDGIDFAALPMVDDGAGGLHVEIAAGGDTDTTHNILRRAAQTHDHYQVETR
ncbi:MAG: hypothetical protein AAGC55_23430, partial [Myxococcota bacterium]